MKKISIITLLISAFIVGKIVKKKLFINNYWWLYIVRNEFFVFNDYKYNLNNFIIVNAWDYNLDEIQSKINVLLEKDGINILYEAIYNKDLKIDLIEKNIKDFTEIIVTSSIQVLSQKEVNRWNNENDWGV